jgi:hypothetical protein
MSGWKNQFKLGIPGSEYSFELNPQSLSSTEGPIVIINENLAADLRKDVVKNYRPTFQVNSNYLTIPQKQQFVALAGLPSFLSFQTRDSDWTFMEQDAPDDTTHVTIRNNSITKLDKALNDVSAAANLTITGIFRTAALTGTNYFTGGSYNRATRKITLGSALPDTNDVFVQYSYLGCLVNMQAINTTAQGGKVDIHSYDFQLEGV